MLAGGDGSRLAVGFRHEFRGTYVGHPDLNRPEALGAQPLAIFADPLSCASHPAMLHVTKANHQPSCWRNDHWGTTTGVPAPRVGDAEPASAPTETVANLEAELPKASESKEELMAWLIRAFDVVNTPDLVALLGPFKAEMAAFSEDALNHPDRRVRRRPRDLVKRIGSAEPESSTRPKEPEPEEDATPDEPIALHALDQLRTRVREETKGRRALFVSNRDDPELGAKLTDLLGISITWCDGSLRRVQAACERIARGSYDLILSATGFQVHGVDTALARAAGAAGVPYVRVNRGRPVACVQAIAREFGLNTHPITQKASSAE